MLQGNLLYIQEKVDSVDQFPLPSLGKKLQAFREEVVHGRGFFLIRSGFFGELFGEHCNLANVDASLCRFQVRM